MEREELTRLFNLYADDVFRLALSYLKNREDAEDACQTVFLKLAQTKSPPGKGSEKPWLLTSTANYCKNLLRSFWRRNVGELTELHPAAAPEIREAYDAVLGLPVKYREVVHLYCVEGYSQGEIAKILGITQTAVQTRMDRARKMLKKEVFSDE